MDVHTKIMKAYKQVPMWWFLIILVVNIAVILYTCKHYESSLQLPWWGVLLACAIACFYTLPIGIIYATTNQYLESDYVTESTSEPNITQAFDNEDSPTVSPLSETVINSDSPYFRRSSRDIHPPKWTNDYHCSTLPQSSYSTAHPMSLFVNYSNVSDEYKSILSALFNEVEPQSFQEPVAVAPVLVWLAAKAFPEKKWIRLIKMPILLGSTAMMPPAGAINYTSWLIVAFIFGYVLFRYRPK
ncbi:hypothetical protein BUALT_Bualt06G0087800 [Buddleja alternifolia]|uniref:Uncharacterized protein n=1 Tax=Buddleja alternifolia TaxID=168488 RepID=A0AAV6XKR1_9LAMI|nr:hypothetical protein BUALT_Bualt06G0087800 [Buddleja alternifolia]